ncbi:hypothetical protein L6R52_19255 [Myxococcota bacterium]|nr:hypothetical protein [Myxococcota bacterium]
MIALSRAHRTELGAQLPEILRISAPSPLRFDHEQSVADLDERVGLDPSVTDLSTEPRPETRGERDARACATEP